MSTNEEGDASETENDFGSVVAVELLDDDEDGDAEMVVAERPKQPEAKTTAKGNSPPNPLTQFNPNPTQNNPNLS